MVKADLKVNPQANQSRRKAPVPDGGARLMFDINFTGNSFCSLRSPTRSARGCFALLHDAISVLRTPSAANPSKTK